MTYNYICVGPIDKHTDRVCLQSIGAETRPKNLPHAVTNPELYPCRCIAQRRTDNIRQNDTDELLEAAWGLIANVNEGVWDLQSAEWQEAAGRWREDYFKTLPTTKTVDPLRLCNQKGCEAEGTYRFTWPGQDEQYICEDHVAQLRGMAAAMGFHLQVTELEKP